MHAFNLTCLVMVSRRVLISVSLSENCFVRACIALGATEDDVMEVRDNCEFARRIDDESVLTV